MMLKISSKAPVFPFLLSYLTSAEAPVSGGNGDRKGTITEKDYDDESVEN